MLFYYLLHVNIPNTGGKISKLMVTGDLFNFLEPKTSEYKIDYFSLLFWFLSG